MFQDPTFWVLVSFVIFIALIGKKIWTMITDALDARADSIKAELDEAEKLREEAQDLLAKYQRLQRDAAREAEDIIERARTEAENYAATAKENLDKALARREKLAVDRIAHAEKAATDDVRRIAAEVAVEAARKLLSEEMKGERADKLIDGAIQDLPSKLH
ncbi:MAG: F0F1 ATP synthase subunit B [Rhodospirillaceae bacterium]|jgi:F-type H+-transporting ATPase subunit b